MRIEPTRAFGNSRHKWSKETQEKAFQLFPSCRQPRRNYRTPPYVTAKPVVKHHKLRPEDQFLVMATDIIWDKLTSEEVIQLESDLLDGKTDKEQTILDRDEIKPVKQRLKAIKAARTTSRTSRKRKRKRNYRPRVWRPRVLRAKSGSLRARMRAMLRYIWSGTH